MAEVVEVGLELGRHGGSMGDVESQDGRSMRCCRPIGGGSGVAVGAASDRVATDSVSVESLRGSCLRCRQFDEGGAGLGAVAIDVAVTLAGLARAGPRDGVGVSLRAGDSREGTHAPPVPAEEQGEVVADVVESAGGAGALTDRTVEEAPEGLGGWEVFMGVEVAVVVEEDLSEVDVVVGVPAEDGLAAAVLNGCRYRVDDRVQVAALVVPLLGDRALVSVRREVASAK